MASKRTRRGASAVTGSLVIIGAVAGPAATAQADPDPKGRSRSVSDAATGSRVDIRNEGDCKNLAVEVSSGPMAPGDAVDSAGRLVRNAGTNAVDVAYRVDESCNVHVEPMRSRRLASGGVSDASLGASLPSDVREYRCSGTNPYNLTGYYGNWMNGTRTLQDVVNIDIAKLRYHHDRAWNGSKTLFKLGRCYVRASTSTSWNHVVDQAASDGFDGAPVENYAYAYAHGRFHSDFTWCNFQPGQNYVMNADFRSRENGDWNITTSQTAQCSATKVSTSYNTSVSTPSGW